MKRQNRMKKMLALMLATLMITGAGAVFADAVKSPLDIVAQLTGKSTTTLIEERQSGKTYGTIAKEAGKLEDFQTQMLAEKKAILDLRVKNGTMTQAQADQIYKAIQSNQATCDGTGQAKIGQKYGAGFGFGKDGSQGRGQGQGRGMGMMGACGNCTVQ